MVRLATLFLLAAVLAAAETGPHVEMTATPAQVEVGATVAVVVTYRWPKNWSVEREPDPAGAFRDLYITSAPPAERSAAGGEERRTFRYSVAAVRSGAWQLPRPTLTARGPLGAITATASEVIIQVGTESAPPNLPSPRPLLVRPPVLPVASNRLWWWIGGGTLLLTAGTAWWIHRRRRAQVSAATAFQILNDDLAAARAPGDAREVGTRISLALRRYAGCLWGFDGPGLTTRETGAALRRLPAGRVADTEAAELMRLLGRLDDLRWSAGDLPAEAMTDLLTLAASWGAAVQQRLDREAAEAAQARKGKAA